MLIWQNKPEEAPYVYQEYPKWIGETLVQNAEEEAALRSDAAPDKPAKKRTRKATE